MALNLTPEKGKKLFSPIYDFVSRLSDCVIWDESTELFNALMFCGAPNISSEIDPLHYAYSSIRKFEKEKNIVFVNNFAFEGKTFLFYLMNQSGIPVPRTFIRNESNNEQFERFLKEVMAANPEYPLLIRKPMNTHTGYGVQIQKASLDLSEDPISAYEIFQEFVYPPKCFNGYVADTRVMMIDGNPVGSYTRIAGEPLLDKGKMIEFPPSMSRVLTNVARGGRTAKTPSHLEKRCLSQSEKTYSAALGIIRETARAFTGEDFSPRFGWGSIDFIYSSNEMPLFLEMDMSPNITAYHNYLAIAKRFSKSISRIGKRKVVIIGESDWSNSVRDFLKEDGMTVFMTSVLPCI